MSQSNEVSQIIFVENHFTFSTVINFTKNGAQSLGVEYLN